MLVKYAYLSGATLNNVLLDVAKLFCNTPIGSLSVACDAANSAVVYNTIASNWELYDTAVAGTAVVRSLNKDGSTYKYAKLAITGNTITLQVYESWNATTHVGTNPGCGGKLNAPVVTPTTVKTLATAAISANGTTTSAAGTLYVYASSTVLVVQGLIVSEFSRSSASLNDTYPCVAIIDSVGHSGLCRIKNPLAAGDLTSSLTGISQTLAMAPDGWIEQASTYPGYVSKAHVLLLDTSNQVVCLVHPLYMQANAIMLGKLYDLRYLASGNLTVAFLDEFVVASDSYILVNGYFCVPKG